jgi:hypothetical protein
VCGDGKPAYSANRRNLTDRKNDQSREFWKKMSLFIRKISKTAPRWSNRLKSTKLGTNKNANPDTLAGAIPPAPRQRQLLA